MNYLSSLAKHWSFSWIDQLTQNNESIGGDPYSERQMRRVKNGHYVPVKPAPLPNPRLIGYSKDMLNKLELSEEDDVHSDSFLKYFSGNVDEAFGEVPQSWATPYALSIMGTRYTNNCPFGTGEGYGDGRAMSIGEVYFPSTDTRWEMQLKGAGQTPFCRGADGRAVLRSSIREFLASEAMFHLNIETTRALSLIKSESETSRRPWYSDQGMASSRFSGMTVDDPRLQKYPMATRKEIIRRVASEKRDPDKLVEEPCAITCRVSPSFLRVGHIDLFARRVLKQAVLNNDNNKVTTYDKHTAEWKELEQIVWHAAFREYKTQAYDPYYDNNDYISASQIILQNSALGIANMVANWVRVGFCQGNFNADNCLIAGRTMDYGPFGFMDEYDPLFAKWTGSGEHFGFLNQPYAGLANYVVLLESILPLLHEHSNVSDLRTKYINDAQATFQKAIDQVWATKLGFDPQSDDTSISNKLWEDLEPLLREAKTDWTIFWRSLYVISREFPIDSKQYDQMLQLLQGNEEVYPRTSPFYDPLSSNLQTQFQTWIQSWREALQQSNDNNENEIIIERMRLANPKYVLREWMLADAYIAAQENNDESKFHALHELIQHPYDEGTQEEEDLFYRRASDDHLLTGGTAFMS